MDPHAPKLPDLDATDMDGTRTNPSFGSTPRVLADADATALPDAASVAPLSLPSQTAVLPAAGGNSGTITFGQYELVGEVARGGMGVVYKARQKGLDRLVALKMVLGVTGDPAAALARFMLEAKAAASLDHPNLVPIYDCGEIDGRMFFTMALVDGPNLKSYVDTNGVPPAAEALALFAQVVAGVAHAHRQGIIHRDLKPANVLMDKDGRPRITDFGLAKLTTGGGELTGTGQVMGTPAYMPPEQARDSKDVGPPADVYSLGAILYFLLTGRPPFAGDTIPDLLIKVVTEAPVPPSKLNPDVPPEVEALCLRCLSKSAADRFPDAQALAEALVPLADKYLPRSSMNINLAGRPGSRSTVADVPGVRSLPLDPTAAAATAAFLPPAGGGKSWKVPALVAAAVLLGGVAVALVVNRGKKPVETVTPNNTNTTPQTVAAADVNGWPGIVAGDFKLTVEFVGENKRDAAGVVKLPIKDNLPIRITADKDCKVMVWTIAPDGSMLTLLPNRHPGGSNVSLKAGQPRTLPDGGYTMPTNPTEGQGVEVLRVLATTGELPELPPGEPFGEFTRYAKADKEKAAGIVRGYTTKAKPADGRPKKAGEVQVTESEILYRVDP